jgi:signal transduction histidine kinase
VASIPRQASDRPPTSGTARAERISADVVGLVLAGEPAGLVATAVARGLARLTGADGAWLLRIGSDGTTRLASWDPAGRGEDPVVTESLEDASTRSSGGPGRVRTGEPGSSPGTAPRGARRPLTAAVVTVTVENVPGVLVVGCVAPSWGSDLPADARSTMSTYLALVQPAIAMIQAAVEARELVERQASLRQIAAVAARGEAPEAVYGTVTEEVSVLLGGALVALSRYEDDGARAVVLAATGGHVARGVQLPVTEENTLGQVRRTGRAERMDRYSGGLGIHMIEELGIRAGVSMPVIVDGVLWGALGVSSRQGPLPAGTEGHLAVFAEIVAAAAASAEARESARLLADEQAALLRVAALVARGAGEVEIFDAVAVEAAGLIDDEPTTLVRYEGDRRFTVLATRNGPAPVGLTFAVPVDDAGTLDAVLRTRQPARQDHYDRIANRSYSHQGFGVGSSVSVPVIVDGRLWGCLGTLNEGRRLPSDTESRLGKFAELVASALANVQARGELERFGEEQGALRRVAEVAASGASPVAVLQAVVSEATALHADATVGLVTCGPRGSTSWFPPGPGPGPDDSSISPARSPAHDGVVCRVLAEERTVRVDAADATPAVPRADAWVSAVGTPVRVEGRTWAVLVVRSRHRRLPPETEDRLVQFAQLAATAVMNDESRTALRRLAQHQAALRRVAELVARGAALEEVFGAVAEEASTMLGGSAAHLYRYDGTHFTTVAVCRSPVLVGARSPAEPDSVGARVTGARRPRRFPVLDEASPRDVHGDRGPGVLVAVPVVVEGRVWGWLSATAAEEASLEDAEDRLAEFAELAAAAIASAENKAALRASRARVVATADETRQRLQRDVHDGAQQRLVQTVLTLKLGLEAADRGETSTDLVREALRQAEQATVELRDLVRGILPAALTRGGLRSGIDSLVATLSLPVDLDLAGLRPGRLPSEVEVTAYFVIAEALTNVVKHAHATRARVMASSSQDRLVVEVSDDGVGGADPRRGSGLTGLSDRVDAMEGMLTVSSGPAGTTVRVVLAVGRTETDVRR